MNQYDGRLDYLNNFQSIFDAAHNGIVVINSQGKIIIYNKAATIKLKLNPDQVIGRFIGEVISKEVWADMQRILQTGVPQIGKKIPLEGSTIIANRTPISIDGEIAGVMSIFQDISEYERIVTELEVYKRINKELDATIESSYDGLYITDGHANTLRVNKAYERISGLKRDDLVGRNMKELVEKGFINQSVSLEVLKLREPVTIMQEIYSQSGKKKVIVTGNPIFDEGKNEIILVVTNVRDITELEDLREELEHRRDLSERYLSELTELRLDLFPKDDIIARSEKTKSIIRMAIKVAQVDTSILITGESGVGKGKLAKLIHQASKRKDNPFIKINCGAIPETLIESELFGYEKGAFTGARIEGKPGLFEIAHNGTIFLDEIGELPLHLQVKLLGILEDKELIRVGGTKSKKVDVRVITASNSDLKRLVEEKRFRNDLFFRLEVIPLHVPPLRERREDILPLIQYFLNFFNSSYGTQKRFSPEAIDCLLNYHYPGNIRELENIIERLVVVGRDDLICIEDMPKYIFEMPASLAESSYVPIQNNKLNFSIGSYEAQLIENVINKYGTTYKAAEILGVNQSTIVRKMKKYGISKGRNSNMH
jgi:PAS domain S-box-containing protein